MKSTFNKAGYGLAWTVLNAFLIPLAFVSPLLWLMAELLLHAGMRLYLGDVFLMAKAWF